MSYIKGLLALSLMMVAGTALSVSDANTPKKPHVSAKGAKPADKKAKATHEDDESLGTIGRQDASVFEPQSHQKKKH